jgi:hypothetical protein
MVSGMYSPAARGRLTEHDLHRFRGETLFDRVARSVCDAGCLPRKELFEAWEMARRVRRRFRGGRVIDVGGGHGLLGQIMLVLDDSSPTATVVDRTVPSSAARIHSALVRTWPRLSGRIHFVADDLGHVAIESGDVVVSCHACGALTDAILERASAAGARVAVMPCCHDHTVSDDGGLAGWLDRSLAIDVVRAGRLVQRGYEVWTHAIPASITPKNRLLLAAPAPLTPEDNQPQSRMTAGARGGRRSAPSR